MNGSPTPPVNPLSAGNTPRRRSPFYPALIVLGCTFLLTGGSLIGFLSTCGNFPNSGPQQPANSIFSWAMLISFSFFALSLLWLFVLVVWAIFRRPEGDQ